MIALDNSKTLKHFFLLHEMPDTDHISPLIWRCLRAGDEVYCAYDSKYDGCNDPRIKSFQNCKNFHFINLRPLILMNRFIQGLFLNLLTIYLFIKCAKIDVSYFEWGEGLPRIKGARRILNLFFGSIRSLVLRVSKNIGVKTICLPHGLNTKNNILTNPHVVRVFNENGAKLPFADRNDFSRYVFANQRHRELFLMYSDLDPAVAVAWGSLRFCPQWREKLRTITPPLPEDLRNQCNRLVVFFLPKWQNHVNRSATIDLIHAVLELPSVKVIVKDHPRKGVANLSAEEAESLLAFSNCLIAPVEWESFALIDASDAIIDVGSSIVFDALMGGKPFIYPRYLHANHLIFEDLAGSLVCSDSEDVKRAVKSVLIEPIQSHSESGDSELVREMIYAGGSPYDVLDFYYNQIRDLAAKVE